MWGSPAVPQMMAMMREKVYNSACPYLLVRVPNGPQRLLTREEQENLREKLLAANPAELKVKIEHDPDLPTEPAPITTARSAEEKLRAYWAMNGAPPPERQERLVAKLATLEKVVLCDPEHR